MDATYGGRFVGNEASRKFWWHKQGQIANKPVSAAEAWTMMGPYGVELLPSYVETGGERFLTGYWSIVRTATPDDPTVRTFGNVKERYTMVDPQTIVDTLDAATGNKPIETMGALRQGRDFFVSYKLPTYGIYDSVINPYAIVHSPYTGEGALRVMVSSVCVVCWNTLSAADRDSTMKLSIKHDTNIVPRFQKWVGGLLGFTEEKIKRQQVVFKAMADKKLTMKQVDALIGELLPMPKKLTKVGIEEEMAQALDANREKWDGYREAMVAKDRERVRRLFDGEGTGAELKANRGTVYGLNAAFTEVIDWTGQALTEETAGTTIADNLFGQAAKLKAKGYATLATFAGVK